MAVAVDAHRRAEKLVDKQRSLMVQLFGPNREEF